MADQVSKKILLSDIVASEKPDRLPSNYIRPIYDRPNLQDVVHDSIPVIDLHDLNGPNRSHVVDKIGQACRDYGFFQVINHTVPESTIANMMQSTREFFKLPEEEKLKMYCDDFNKKTSGLFSSGYLKEAGNPDDWRDFMGLRCYPIEDYIHEWPTNPTLFRNHAVEYLRNVEELALQLMEAVSESLGLNKDHIKGGQSEKVAQHLILNYYPPCPQPDLTYGLPGHTDPYHISILLQDEVPGLQVLKDDRWVAVDPVPNAFIINVGDMVQVISNDKYKSVLHRAVVNSDKDRISIPTFYMPPFEAVIQPAPELVTNDEPAVYKPFMYEEYYDKFFKRDRVIHKNSLNMFLAT